MTRTIRNRRVPILPLAALGLMLQGCGGALPPPLPADADLTAALVPKTGDTPPSSPEGACWQGTTIPAVIETVTEQVQATPARIGPDGVMRAPATFRTETRQKIVSDRREAWFRTPCPETLTPDLVSSLQRALKARGLFLGPLTGLPDAETAAAIRAWQKPRGLDSDVLALATAERLGLIAVPR